MRICYIRILRCAAILVFLVPRHIFNPESKSVRFEFTYIARAPANSGKNASTQGYFFSIVNSDVMLKEKRMAKPLPLFFLLNTLKKKERLNPCLAFFLLSSYLTFR